MTLHHDLLEQANHLANRERKKPKQASLRRSVSSAYYALFHLFASETGRLLAPPKPAGLDLAIRRVLGHGEMKKVCKSFISGQAGRGVQTVQAGNILEMAKSSLSFPLAPDLVAVLDAFCDLQEARHDADYNLLRSWRRLDALNSVQTAQQAFLCWAKVRGSANANTFLTVLALQRR